MPLLIEENQLVQNALIESNDSDNEPLRIKSLQRKKSILSSPSSEHKEKINESLLDEEKGTKNTLADVFLRGCSFDENDACDPEFKRVIEKRKEMMRKQV